MMKTIDKLAEVVMQGFAAVVRDAGKDSPMARAKVALGERFADVACEAMRKHLRVAIIDRREENLASLNCGLGELAARAIVVTVISDSIRDVIAAAGCHAAA